jgi:hypothetical protein
MSGNRYLKLTSLFLATLLALSFETVAKPKSCSQKRDGVITGRCMKGGLKMTEAQCRQSVEAIYKKCLKTGTWYGRKQTIPGLRKE